MAELQTRLRIHCHIWQIIMQLGQPQLTFSNRSESEAGRKWLDAGYYSLRDKNSHVDAVCFSLVNRNPSGRLVAG